MTDISERSSDVVSRGANGRRVALIVGVAFAALGLAGCASIAHSYMSPEEKQAHGRELMQSALQNGDVVSIRSSGGVIVLRITEISEHEYCAISLAIWESERYFEGWRDLDDDDQENILCTTYHGIEAIRPMDMRECQGRECLWLRGL